jgi:hypothetical protein
MWPAGSACSTSWTRSRAQSGARPVHLLCKKVAAGAVFRTSHRSPRCVPSPLYSRLREEAPADLSTRGHRGPGRCLKVWAPFHLVDTRNHDPVPVASSTRQETHPPRNSTLHQSPGGGIEPSRLPNTSTSWRWLQDKLGSSAAARSRARRGKDKLGLLKPGSGFKKGPVLAARLHG